MARYKKKSSYQKKSSDSDSESYPYLENMPPLPVVDWAAIGRPAPEHRETPADELPPADAVVITWAEAEWAALEQVFVASSGSEAQPMPYSDRSTGYWDGWQKYDQNLPPVSAGNDDWTYWGYARLVAIEGRNVLLFKSNTHLDWPGEPYLEALIKLFAEQVKPQLILSIGTAGGARLEDHEGTVNVVRAGTLYQGGQPPAAWPDYASDWPADGSLLGDAAFRRLLFPVPTTEGDLETLAGQFNSEYKTDYTLDQLNALGLDLADPEPRIHDLTSAGTSLLTTSTFVVGTTDACYAGFACIEMDDAVIGKVCAERKIDFGFVRNISDPVQNAALPGEDQGNWGSYIYEAYGFYTSYNGALAAWALLSAQWSS